MNLLDFANASLQAIGTGMVALGAYSIYDGGSLVSGGVLIVGGLIAYVVYELVPYNDRSV